jgi:hypothetical protein
MLNPYLHVLAAVYAGSNRLLYDARGAYFRPLARGSKHPAPAVASSLLLLTPWLFSSVCWVTFAPLNTRSMPGRNRYGAQGAHLNPLDLFLNPLGLFLRTSILFI